MLNANRDDQTQVKTLWSETLVEILLDALKNNRNDAVVLGTLRELREKGYKRQYVLDKVERALGTGAAIRVRRLTSSR